MEQNLSEFFNLERIYSRICELFQKLKRNLKDIEDRRKHKKQISKINKDIENIKKNIFKQNVIPKSIYKY